jgi:sulfiredoxin
MVMREHKIRIDQIYIPMKRRHTVDARRVEALAEDILENGQQNPIWIRRDADRYVLVEGLHRLEACKALGEQTITAVFVQARQF